MGIDNMEEYGKSLIGVAQDRVEGLFGLFGGGSSSKSSVTHNVKDTLKVMNRNISKSISKNIMKNSSSMSAKNTITIEGDGNVVSGVKQTITAKINWSAVLSEDNTADMRNTAKANLKSDIQAEYDQEQKKNGMAPRMLPIPDVNAALDTMGKTITSVLGKSSSEQNATTNITNDKSIDILYENIISSETLSEIKDSMEATNEFTVRGNENVVSDIEQTIAIDKVSKIVQSKVMDFLAVSDTDVKDEVIHVVKTKQKQVEDSGSSSWLGDNLIYLIILIFVIITLIGGGVAYSQAQPPPEQATPQL